MVIHSNPYLSTRLRHLLLVGLAGAATIVQAEASFVQRAGNILLPQLMKRGTGSVNHDVDQHSFLRQPPVDSMHRSLKEIPRSGALESTTLKMTNVMFDNAPLWKSFSIIGAVNALGCVISLVTGSHLHLDLLGTGAFALAVLPQIMDTATIPRVRQSSQFVAIWSVKLASFLFVRVLKNKHDARLDTTMSTTSGTIGFWVVSALWGMICGLPHYIGSTSSDLGNGTATSIGTGVYIAGLLIETLADYQKWMFKINNPRKFCDDGLWSISQHPNFFGNLLLWAGITIMNAPSMIEPVSASSSLLSRILSFKRLGVALLSPLFMSSLFYGQATGAMLNSVELANAKYGDDPNYKKYIESVPLIIPRLLPFK